MSLLCDCCSVISNTTSRSPGVRGARTFAIWLTDSVSQKSGFTLASGVSKIEFPTVHSRTLLTRLQASPSRNQRQKWELWPQVSQSSCAQTQSDSRLQKKKKKETKQTFFCSVTQARYSDSCRVLASVVGALPFL